MPNEFDAALSYFTPDPKALAEARKKRLKTADSYEQGYREGQQIREEQERAAQEQLKAQERLDKERAKAEAEQADLARKQRLADTERAYAREGRPTRTDAMGEIFTVDDDETWQRKQADKKVAEDLKAQARADAAFRKSEAVRLNQAETKLKAGLDDFDTAEAIGSQAVSAKASEIISLSQAHKAASDDTLPPAQRSQITSTPDYQQWLAGQPPESKDNPFAIGDYLATRIQSARKEKELLENSERTIKVAKLTKEAELKPALGEIQQRRDVLPITTAPAIPKGAGTVLQSTVNTGTPTPASADPERAAAVLRTQITALREKGDFARADALELRLTNPAKWEAQQRAFRQTATPEQLAQTVEAGRADITQQWQETEQVHSVLSAQRQAYYDRLDRAKAKNDALLNQPYSDGDVAVIRDEMTGEETRWHKAAADEYNGALQGLNSWQQSNQEKIDLLNLNQQQLQIEAANLDKHVNQLNYLGREQQRQKDGENASKLNALRQIPGMAEFADETERRSAEFKQRQAELERKYPDPKVRQIAAQALQEDFAKSEESMQERMAAKADNINSLYADYGTGGSVTDWLTTDNPIHVGKLKKLAEERGFTEQEARGIMDLRRKADWNHKLPGDDKGVRKLPNGNLSVSPDLWLDPKDYEKAVNDSDATPEAKKAAISTRRDMAAPTAAAMLLDLQKVPEFAEYLAKTTSGTPLERMEQFQADLKSGGALAANVQRFYGGNANLGVSLFGALNAVTGVDYFRKVAEDYQAEATAHETAASMAGTGTNAIGRGISQLSGAAPSLLGAMVPGAALARVGVLVNAGRAGFATARAAQMRGVAEGFKGATGALWGHARASNLLAASEAAMLSGASLNRLALTGASFGSGAQSFGSTYLDAIQAYEKKGLSPTEAHGKALAAALLSGASTAALTGAFGLTGSEAMLAQRELVKKTLAKRAAEFGIGFTQEALEEGSDQFIQGVIAQQTYNPTKKIGDILSESLEAALIGGVLGGGMTALSETVDYMAGKRELLAEDLAAADAEITNYQDETADTTENDHRRNRAALAKAIAQGVGLDGIEEVILNSAGWTRKDKDGVTRADGTLTKIKDYTGPNVLDVDSSGKVKLDKTYVSKLGEVMPVTAGLVGSKQTTWHKPGQIEEPVSQSPAQPSPVSGEAVSKSSAPLSPAPAKPAPSAKPSSGEVGPRTPAGTSQTRGTSAQGAAAVTDLDTAGKTQAAAPAVSGAAADSPPPTVTPVKPVNQVKPDSKEAVAALLPTYTAGDPRPQRAWEIANHLEMAGLDRPTANIVAANAIRFQGIVGKTVNEQVTSKEFNTFLDEQGATGDRSTREGSAPLALTRAPTPPKVSQPTASQEKASPARSPSPNLPPRSNKQVPARPPRNGRDTSARDKWDEEHGDMRKGGRTHNDDGSPYQPTVFDETVAKVVPALKDATFEESLEAIGSDKGLELGSSIEKLLNDGWVWDEASNKMVDPQNRGETPLQAIQRIDGISRAAEQTAPAKPAPVSKSPPKASPSLPAYAALRERLKSKDISTVDAVREVIRLSGETDTGVLQDLLTDHLGLKKPSAAAAVETLRAAGELKGDKNDDISIASSKRASDRQTKPSDKAYSPAKEFIPATQGALAENPAWARAKLSMLAHTPPARRRWAYRFLTHLENTISQRASLYEAIAIGKTALPLLNGQKMAVIPHKEKITLAIDLDRMLADFSYLGDPRAAAIATVMEEDIHAAQMHLMRREKDGGKWKSESLAQQWRDLPDAIKKAVWQSYNNVKASDNQSMPTSWDDGDAYHLQSEFLRMLVQGRIDPKSITEAVDASPGLIQSIKDLLADLYDTLRSLIKGLPTSQAVTLDQQVTELKAALEQLGKPSTAEELRTKMFLRDPSAVAMQALKNGTVFDHLATQDALFTPQGLRRVWDLLTPEMRAQVERLKKTAAPWLSKKRSDNAGLTRDLLTFLLDPRAAEALAQANLTGSPAATASTGMVRRALKAMSDYFRSNRPDFAQTLGSLDLTTAQVLQQMQSLLVTARAQFEASAAVQKLPTLIIAEPQADDEDARQAARRMMPGVVNRIQRRLSLPPDRVGPPTAAELSAQAMVKTWLEAAVTEKAFFDAANAAAELALPGVSDAARQKMMERWQASQADNTRRMKIDEEWNALVQSIQERVARQFSPWKSARESAEAIEALIRQDIQQAWAAAILATAAQGERRYYLRQQELTPVQIRQIESLLQVANGDLALAVPYDQRAIGIAVDSGAPVRQMGLSRENALAVLGIRIGTDGTAYAAANAPVYIEGGTILIKQTTLDDLSQTLPITRRQFRLSEDEQRARIGLRGTPQPVTASAVAEARAADQQQQDTSRSTARLEQLEAVERQTGSNTKPEPLIDASADPATGEVGSGERGDLLTFLADTANLTWPPTEAGGEWDWFLELLSDYYNPEATGNTKRKALRDSKGNVIGFKDAPAQVSKLGITNKAKRMAREGDLSTPAAVVEYLIQEGVVKPAVPTKNGEPRNLTLGSVSGIDEAEMQAEQANYDLTGGIGNAVLEAIEARKAARHNRQNSPERAAELQTLRFERDTRSGPVVVPAHELAPLSDDGPTFITSRSQDGDMIPLEVASYEWQPIDPESAEADDYLEGHPAWRGAEEGNPERMVITLRGGTYYGQQTIPGDTLLRVEDAGNTGIGMDLGDGKGDFVTDEEAETPVETTETEDEKNENSSDGMSDTAPVSTNPELEAEIYAELRKAGLLASSSRLPVSAEGVSQSPPLASSDRFYSQLARTVEAKMPNRADAKTLRGIVENPQNRIKAEELKWSGLLAWADSQPQPLTKQQVLDFLATEGSVRFEETRMAQTPRKIAIETVSPYGVELFALVDTDTNVAIEIYDSRKEAEDAAAKSKSDTTRNTQHTLPGGENPREVVVTWKQAPTASELAPGQAAQMSRQELIQWYRTTIYDDIADDATEADISTERLRELYVSNVNLREQNKSPVLDNRQTPNDHGDTTHYGDLDALAWFRANDRDNGQGLLVEEFQSKWAELWKAAFDEFIKENYPTKNRAELTQEEKAKATDYANTKIPDAPWVSNTAGWVVHLFKRALADAVAEGKQWIGWTSGDTQADRYDLSKQVSKIGVTRAADLSYSIDAMPTDGGRYSQIATGLAPEKLAEVVGKELAAKIIDRDIAPGANAIFSGLDLKVGGEGMRKFYDDILVKEFGKYVKPWGGKVTQSEVASATTLAEPTWKTFDNSDWDTFGGAEPFANNDDPVIAQAQLLIDGQSRPVSVILDANGMQVIDGDGENVWMVPNTIFPGQPIEGWWQSAESAQNSAGIAWKNENHRLWSSFDTILGEDATLAPQLGTTPIWRIDITPAMRESVAAGQALFASARHNFSPELVEEARAEMKSDNTTDPDFQGGAAWLTPDGRWINIGDGTHYEASGIVRKHGYGPAMAAGYVRIIQEGQELFAEFFGPLTPRIKRQVRDGAIEQQIDEANIIFEPFAEKHYGKSKDDGEDGDSILAATNKIRDLADDTANDAYAAGDRTFYAYLQRMKRLLLLDDGFEAFKPYMRGSWTTIADTHGLPEVTRASAAADYFRLARQKSPAPGGISQQRPQSPTPRQTPAPAPPPAATQSTADLEWEMGLSDNPTPEPWSTPPGRRVVPRDESAEAAPAAVTDDPEVDIEADLEDPNAPKVAELGFEVESHQKDKKKKEKVSKLKEILDNLKARPTTVKNRQRIAAIQERLDRAIEDLIQSRGATLQQREQAIDEIYGPLAPGVTLLNTKTQNGTVVPHIMRGRALMVEIDGTPHVATRMVALPSVGKGDAEGVRFLPLAGDKSNWTGHINTAIKKAAPNLDAETDIYIEPYGGGLVYLQNLDILRRTKKPVLIAVSQEFEPERFAIYSALARNDQTVIRDLRQMLKDPTQAPTTPEGTMFAIKLFGTKAKKIGTKAKKKGGAAVKEAFEQLDNLAALLQRPNVKLMHWTDAETFRAAVDRAGGGKRVTLLEDSNYADLFGEETEDQYAKLYERDNMPDLFQENRPKGEFIGKDPAKLLAQKLVVYRAVLDAGGTIIATNNMNHTLLGGLLAEFGDQGHWFGYAHATRPVKDGWLKHPDGKGVLWSTERPEYLAILRKGVDTGTAKYGHDTSQGLDYRPGIRRSVDDNDRAAQPRREPSPYTGGSPESAELLLRQAANLGSPGPAGESVGLRDTGRAETPAAGSGQPRARSVERTMSPLPPGADMTPLERAKADALQRERKAAAYDFTSANDDLDERYAELKATPDEGFDDETRLSSSDRQPTPGTWQMAEKMPLLTLPPAANRWDSVETLAAAITKHGHSLFPNYPGKIEGIMGNGPLAWGISLGWEPTVVINGELINSLRTLGKITDAEAARQINVTLLHEIIHQAENAVLADLYQKDTKRTAPWSKDKVTDQEWQQWSAWKGGLVGVIAQEINHTHPDLMRYSGSAYYKGRKTRKQAHPSSQLSELLRQFVETALTGSISEESPLASRFKGGSLNKNFYLPAAPTMEGVQMRPLHSALRFLSRIVEKLKEWIGKGAPPIIADIVESMEAQVRAWQKNPDARPIPVADRFGQYQLPLASADKNTSPEAALRAIFPHVSDPSKWTHSHEPGSSPADLRQRESLAHDFGGGQAHRPNRAFAEARITGDGQSQRQELGKLLEGKTVDEASALPLGTLLDHGGEHTVYVSDDSSYVTKLTKPGLYGYVPTEDVAPGITGEFRRLLLRPATPAEYLLRLATFSRLTGIDWQVHGLDSTSEAPDSPVILSTQPFIPSLLGPDGKPVKVTQKQIDTYMASIGFEPLYEMTGTTFRDERMDGTTYWHPKEQILATDARPANFKITPSNQTVPLDLMLAHYPLASSTRTPTQTIEATGLAPAISVNGKPYTGRTGMTHGEILGEYVWRKVFTPQQRRDDPNQDNAVNYAYEKWMDSRGSGFDDFGFLDTRSGKFLTREEAYTLLKERGFSTPADGYSAINESLDSVELFDSTPTENSEPRTANLPASDRILAAAAKTNTNPTKPQQDAENYQTGKVTVHGLRLSIENPAGSVRKGTDANGKAWEVTMPHHYGRILGTTGADKDHVDFFLGPDPTSPMAFVVNQRRPGNGHFDEHKVMLGFTHPGTAARGYLDSYSPGWRGYSSIVPMTIPQLKHWLEHGKMGEAVTKAPVVSNDTKPKTTRPTTTHTFPDGYHLTGPGLHLLPASIRAYHGTPHDIDPKTGFSTSKIGTGEGAQVYGWGLYFAEAMKVAEQYRRTLSTPVLIIGDKEFTRREGADAFTEWAAKQLPKDWPHMAVSRFKEVLSRFHYDVTSFVAHPDEAADDARKVFEKFLRTSEVSNDVLEQAMTALGNIVDYAEAPSPQDTTEGRWYARAIGWKPSIVRHSLAAGAFYDMFSRIGWYASTFQNAPSVLQTEYEQTIIAQNEELERLRSDPNAAQNKPQINAALDRIRIAETALGMLKDGRVKLLPNPRRGNFYTVDILGDPEQFLQWDEPLSKQSQFIRDAFTRRASLPMTDAQKKAFDNLRLNGDVEARQAKHDAVLKQREAWFVQTKAKNNSDYAWDWPAEDQRRLQQWNDQLLELDKDIRGAYQGFGELYRQFTTDSNGTPKDTSEFLAGMGIKGVRYLDGSSRSSGQGTHNYVLFDDKLVRILEKNGQPIDTPALASSNRTPSTIAFGSLPEDMQVLLVDGGWAEPGQRLHVKDIPIQNLPQIALNNRDRGEVYASKMGNNLPPILIVDGHLMDGKHRIWAARKRNQESIKSIIIQKGDTTGSMGSILPASPRQILDATSRASFNHLDRWFTGALARQAKRVTSSDPVTAATQAAAAWWNQDTPGVSTLRSLKELAQRELLPETVLPREIMSAMREMQIKQSMGQQKALDVGRALSDKPKFSDLHYPPEFVENPMHREAMFSAMEQGKVDTLPPALQEVAHKLRQMLVEAGREAVKQGRMNPDTFEGLRTNFMPRFTKEEAQASAGDFAKRFKLGVKDILAQRSTAFHITDTSRKDKNGLPQIVSHAKGKWRFDSQQARDAYYEDLINRQTLDGDLAKNDMHWMNRGDARALRSITPEMLKAPATMTKEQRDVVARVQRQLRNQFKKEDPYEPKDLVKDPVYAVMRYLAQMTHDNAVAEFFNVIDQNPDWTSTTEMKGFTQIPDNDRFGALAGKYVRKDIADQVMELAHTPAQVIQLYDTLLRLWKTGKTVLNPATHARNILGNLPFAQFAGNNALNPANWTHYAHALRTLRAGGDEYRQLYETGVLGADYASTELRAALENIVPVVQEDDSSSPIRHLIALGNRAAQWGKAHSLANVATLGSVGATAGFIAAGPLGALAGAGIAAAANPIYRGALWAYRLEDDLFKAAAFFKARSMGMNKEQAAQHVRDWFPYYDKPTSTTLKFAGRTTMPFLSFFRESARIGAKAAKERPLSLAATLAIPTILTALSQAALGLDDDDMEDVKSGMRGKGAKLLGMTPLAGVPIFSMLIPWRTASGQLQQIDLSSTHPMADFLANRVENWNNDPWWQAWSRSALANPMLGALYTAATGRDPFGDRTLWDSSYTSDEKAKAILGHAWKTAMPPLAPGGTNWTMIDQSTRRQANKTLALRSPAQAVGRGVLGVDVRNADPDIYSLADAFRKRRGLPVTEGNTAYPTDAAGRARKALFEELVQPQPDPKALAKQLQSLNDLGKPVRTVADVLDILDYRRPDGVINPKELRAPFRASLAPEARRVLDTALKEFQRARTATPGAFAKARQQIKPTTRAPITDEP